MSITQQAPPKYEPASQIPIVNAAVARKPDAIIVAATDAEALQAPLEQAAQRGIKVVTFDTSVSDPSFAVTHVSSDIVEAGRIVAEQLVTLTGGEGKLMYIDHAPGVGFAQDLREGFTEVVEGEPGPRPAADPVLRPGAAEGEHHHAHHDHPASGPRRRVRGRRLRQPGRGARRSSRPGKLDQVKTVAFDAFVQNMKLLEAGKLDSVVSVAAREYGAATVKAAVDALNGKSVPEEDPAEDLRVHRRERRRSGERALPVLACPPVARETRCSSSAG